MRLSVFFVKPIAVLTMFLFGRHVLREGEKRERSIVRLNIDKRIIGNIWYFFTRYLLFFSVKFLFL